MQLTALHARPQLLTRPTRQLTGLARPSLFFRGGRPPYQRHLVPAAVNTEPNRKTEAEETTEKYGLEAGLYKVMTSGEEEGKPGKGQQAKELLKRYGSAYLITSISFAIVSFGACYFAVNAGVDVGSLLAKVGLQVTDTSEKVGTVAIAYAAHKALSPVRFPPTVALTPLVARWLGREEPEKAAGEEGSGKE
ncbi:hypothetical protein N2152v2_005189 [Parachlorella kessleri]